jgi:hypothetical protein
MYKKCSSQNILLIAHFEKFVSRIFKYSGCIPLCLLSMEIKVLIVLEIFFWTFSILAIDLNNSKNNRNKIMVV